MDLAIDHALGGEKGAPWNVQTNGGFSQGLSPIERRTGAGSRAEEADLIVEINSDQREGDYFIMQY